MLKITKFRSFMLFCTALLFTLNGEVRAADADTPDHDSSDLADFDLYDRNREGLDWKDWKEDYGRRNTKNDDEGYTFSDPDYQYYNHHSTGSQWPRRHKKRCVNCQKEDYYPY
jgi:hypothetical protein